MLRVVFMGSPEFAVPALHAVQREHRVELVVTQADKPAGRGRKLVAPPVKVAALAAGLQVVQPTSVRRPEFLELLARTSAELGIVVAYGKILPPAVLTAFPRGCINIHGSLLPAYRGAAPVQWALARGEKETGVTIMQLDEGMDTGPMLLARSEPIRDDDTAGSLLARLAPLGAELLIEALARLEAGTLVATPQDASRASMAPMLRKEDGEVDWDRPAHLVSCHIRAMDPWPGATTTLGGEALKLFQPRVIAGDGRPGEVLGSDERGLRVACGDGAVAIGEIQAAGRKRLPARAFLSGRSVPAGTALGGRA